MQLSYKQHLYEEQVTIPNTLYHGSKYDFSSFDLSKIGTGEGLQKYGYGIYLTNSLTLAEYYATQIRKNSTIYTVKVPLNFRIYDWDGEIDDWLQSEIVDSLESKGYERDAMQIVEEYESYREYITMNQLYDIVSHVVGSPIEASKMFSDLGLDGVKAEDIQGRGQIFVIFNPERLRIIDKDSI